MLVINRCKINIVLDNKLIDQFRYSPEPHTEVYCLNRPQYWRINPTNSVVIPQSLALRSRLNFNISKLANWQLCFSPFRVSSSKSSFSSEGPGPGAGTWATTDNIGGEKKL